MREERVDLSDVIAHRLPPSAAPHAYEIFDDRQDDCLKVVLQPGS